MPWGKEARLAALEARRLKALMNKKWTLPSEARRRGWVQLGSKQAVKLPSSVMSKARAIVKARGAKKVNSVQASMFRDIPGNEQKVEAQALWGRHPIQNEGLAVSHDSVPHPIPNARFKVDSQPYGVKAHLPEEDVVSFDPEAAGVFPVPEMSEQVKEWTPVAVDRKHFIHDDRLQVVGSHGISPLWVETDQNGVQWWLKHNRTPYDTVNQSVAERLAYGLSTLLGVKTPPVFLTRDNHGEISSGMKSWPQEQAKYPGMTVKENSEALFVSSRYILGEKSSQLIDAFAMGGSEEEQIKAVEDAALYAREFPIVDWLKYGLFENLGANTDRNHGNWYVGRVVDSDGQVTWQPLMLDNSLMFDGWGADSSEILLPDWETGVPQGSLMKEENPDFFMQMSITYSAELRQLLGAWFAAAYQVNHFAPNSPQASWFNQQLHDAAKELARVAEQANPENMDVLVDELPDWAFGEDLRVRNGSVTESVLRKWYKAWYRGRYKVLKRYLDTGLLPGMLAKQDYGFALEEDMMTYVRQTIGSPLQRS